MRTTIISLALPFLLLGCRSTQYVPMESVRTEYVDRTNTVHVTDSVINDRLIFMNGDTVYVTETRDRWRIRTERDTVFIERTDTIRMPCTVEKPVEVDRSPAWWETTLMILGGVFLLIIAYILYRKVKKKS